MSNIPSVSALEGVHEFPEWYTIKVFGPGEESFVNHCRKAANNIIDNAEEHLRISTKKSSAGNYTSVTVEIYVDHAKKVQDVYRELLELDDVRMII